MVAFDQTCWAKWPKMMKFRKKSKISKSTRIIPDQFPGLPQASRMSFRWFLSDLEVSGIILRNLKFRHFSWKNVEFQIFRDFFRQTLNSKSASHPSLWENSHGGLHVVTLNWFQGVFRSDPEISLKTDLKHISAEISAWVSAHLMDSRSGNFLANVSGKVTKNDENHEKIENLKIDQDHSRLIPWASPSIRNEFSVILDWSGSV